MSAFAAATDCRSIPPLARFGFEIVRWAGSPARVGDRAVEHRDGVRVDVAGVAAAGLVGDLNRPRRRCAVSSVAEANRCPIVLVDEHDEVAIVRPRREQRRLLGVVAVARGRLRRPVQVRSSVEHDVGARERARVHNLALVLRVFGDALAVGGARRDEDIGEELEEDGTRDGLGAEDLPRGDEDVARHRRVEVERHGRRRGLRAGEAVADEARERDEAPALRRGHDPRLADLRIEVEAKRVADEGEELEEDVAEARDLVLGPVGKHTLDELDESRAQAVEVPLEVANVRGRSAAAAAFTATPRATEAAPRRALPSPSSTPQAPQRFRCAARTSPPAARRRRS